MATPGNFNGSDECGLWTIYVIPMVVWSISVYTVVRIDEREHGELMIRGFLER